MWIQKNDHPSHEIYFAMISLYLSVFLSSIVMICDNLESFYLEIMGQIYKTVQLSVLQSNKSSDGSG